MSHFLGVRGHWNWRWGIHPWVGKQGVNRSESISIWEWNGVVYFGVDRGEECISFRWLVKHHHELLSCQDGTRAFPNKGFSCFLQAQVMGDELAFPTLAEKSPYKWRSSEDGCSHIQTCPLHSPHTCAWTEAIALTHQRNRNVKE